MLQPLVAAHPAHDQHRVSPRVRHGPLRRLHQHGEHRLLQRVAEVRRCGLAARHQALVLGADLREDAAEADIHALDDVGQLQELRALQSLLLDVVTWAGIIGQPHDAGEAVQAIAHCDVDGLAEDPVAPVRVGDDLRVAAAHIQHHGVGTPCGHASHLDVAHAMVHAHQRLAQQQRHHASRHGARPQRTSHTWPLGETDDVHICRLQACLAQRRADDGGDVRLVVPRRLSREKALACGGDEGLARVGQNGVGALRIEQHAHTHLVGAALNTESHHATTPIGG
mmetsp:Transcript_15849/g.26524  ORF Transcript_15849/g.26524 Transcript_15849/m.26524 type:complete len:282 (+) Transcript_15849:1654-2499(+)